MVSRDGKRCALEIQFSRQDADEFIHRQERYAAEGIECLWLAAEVNRDVAAVVPSVDDRSCAGCTNPQRSGCLQRV